MEEIRKNLLKKIKSRGYWLINLRPIYDQGLEIEQCKSVIEKSSVRYRGWDYPHISKILLPGNDYYEGWVDWGMHKEIWRMYQSGQFIHYKALYEDWLEIYEYNLTNIEIKPGEILSVMETIYFLTEIFEFISRLIRNGLYEKGVNVRIYLCNTFNRKLEILEPGRLPLLFEYKTVAESLSFDKEYSDLNKLKEDSSSLALDAIIYFFKRFNWENPPIEVIKIEQEKLKSGKI